MSNAVEQIKIIIDDNQDDAKYFKNFVLQGGAGSGKTESLKEVILYISEKYPNKKIACITLTNAAVEEMKLRIGNNHVISTIHSFLNHLIKNYKRNLSTVIHNIFCISPIHIEEHDDYKKKYKDYSNKLLSFKDEKTEQVISKREYKQQSEKFNESLNQKIEILNDYIKEEIAKLDHNNIIYNETRFDSFKELSFSHDSLLILANRLCKEFNLFAKIITDKYDFIFIDEYQDTNEEVIDIFLNLLPNKKTTIGLFGDAMQGIYENGIGNVETQIKKGQLIKIDKEDNYRCSKEVISFINTIRDDSIKQKVALKLQEEESSRNGKVQFYYSIYDGKPNTFSSEESKNLYLEKLDQLVKEVQSKEEYIDKKYKILMLTNRSISKRIGFNTLFSIFSSRYIEIKEEIEKELARIQISDIVDMCRAYKNKEYNYLLVKLRKNNFQITSMADKKRISDYFEFLLDKDISLKAALEHSFANRLIKKSEQYKNYIKKRDNFLEEFENNEDYKNLEKYYKEGSNTRNRLKNNNAIDITEEEFDLFQKSFKKKFFYNDLFSDDLKLQEAINYFNYLNEETEYITLHKTKGTGIDNVILVLDEYFWTKYNFKSIYNSTDAAKTLKNKKIFYVACSRTISNLAIIRLIESDEEELVTKYFKSCEIKKIE